MITFQTVDLEEKTVPDIMSGSIHVHIRQDISCQIVSDVCCVFTALHQNMSGCDSGIAKMATNWLLERRFGSNKQQSSIFDREPI